MIDEEEFDELVKILNDTEEKLRKIVEVNKYEQYFPWSHAASTPVEDVQSACRQFEKLHGMRPSRLYITSEQIETLADHPDICHRVSYNASALSLAWRHKRPSREKTMEHLPELFGINVTVSNTKSFEIGEIECPFVKTIWFSQEQDCCVYHWHSDGADEYYEALKIKLGVTNC